MDKINCLICEHCETRYINGELRAYCLAYKNVVEIVPTYCREYRKEASHEELSNV